MTLKCVTLIHSGIIQTADTPRRRIAYQGNLELVEWVKRLLEEGYAFVDTPSGWPPAELLRELQAQGEMTFAFTAVTWSGPGVYRTYQVSPC
ncbi:hypothetical protein HW452_12660 [Halomonas aquamarina]|uniref:Uncharacterized protein n=1 Tax=Vreelandella aquamarina TaxID=77097 RepID=A0ACC5VVV2_9GAMM|nr:hypothetical protein [Halomonas aquamarina]MBZ5488375.1 hypothetical protein [Halomonas aquamarina]